MKTEEWNHGVSFRVPTTGYVGLCDALAALPGVHFSRRPRFFWSGGDVGAEFKFKGVDFIVDADNWDGALWVLTKDLKKHSEEMVSLRAAVEAWRESNFLGRLWRHLISETFT